jgi:hypothetical protein
MQYLNMSKMRSTGLHTVLLILPYQYASSKVPSVIGITIRYLRRNDSRMQLVTVHVLKRWLKDSLQRIGFIKFLQKKQFLFVSIICDNLSPVRKIFCLH